MESALKEVSKHCQQQLQALADCIDSHPSNWETNCALQKKEVTICAETNVKMVRLVKHLCKDAIEGYENCLSNNRENPYRCIDELDRLNKCTDKIGTEN